MENKDMPAMPLVTSEGVPVTMGAIGSIPDGVAIGLTKREYFAGLAMQGYLSSHRDGETTNWVVEASISDADDLLKALEGEDIRYGR